MDTDEQSLMDRYLLRVMVKHREAHYRRLSLVMVAATMLIFATWAISALYRVIP